MKKIIITLVFVSGYISATIANTQIPNLFLDSYFNAANFNLKIGDKELAEEIAAKAVDSAEKNQRAFSMVDVYGKYGTLLYDMGKIVGAKRNLTRAMKLFCEYNIANYSMAPVINRYLTIIDNNNSITTKNLPPFINLGFAYRELPLYIHNGDLDSTYTALLQVIKKKDDILAEARLNAVYGLQLADNIRNNDSIAIRKAISALETSITLFYKTVGNTPELYPLENKLLDLYAIHNVQKQINLYGSVEVGSKGVKMSVIRLLSDSDDEYSYSNIFDSTFNTDFISFTESSFTETLDAFISFKKLLGERFSIPGGNQFFAISGGVYSQAELKEKMAWLYRFQDSVRSKTGDDNIKVEVLDPCNEAKLSHLGIVNYKYRYISALVDIGSGNTKGGYFPEEGNGKLKCFNIAVGTKSLADSIRADTLAAFLSQLTELTAKIKKEHIAPEFSRISPIRNLYNIVLSGGICWAISTIMKPEFFSKAFVPITREEVELFKAKVLSNYDRLIREPEVLLIKITRQSDRDKVMKEIKRVFRAFDQKALLAGTELLIATMNELSTGVTKTFRFARFAQVGWVSGYIIQAVDEARRR